MRHVCYVNTCAHLFVIRVKCEVISFNILYYTFIFHIYVVNYGRRFD